MSTEPFNNILKPVKNGFQEIGQPTYVEMLWATECEVAPAIGRAFPNPSLSLRRIAFGKDCINSLEPVIADPPELVAKSSEPSNDHNSYSILASAHTYKLKSADIKYNLLSSKLRNIIRNDTLYTNHEDEVPEDDLHSAYPLSLGDYWSKIGTDFGVEYPGELIINNGGNNGSLSLSANGAIAAIGVGNGQLLAPRFQPDFKGDIFGYVQVYVWSNGWIRRGPKISNPWPLNNSQLEKYLNRSDDPIIWPYYGQIVKLTADGNRLAIVGSGPETSQNPIQAWNYNIRNNNEIRIYEWNGKKYDGIAFSNPLKISERLYEEARITSIDFNDQGNLLIVCAEHTKSPSEAGDATGIVAGARYYDILVRLYEIRPNGFVKIGNDIIFPRWDNTYSLVGGTLGARNPNIKASKNGKTIVVGQPSYYNGREYNSSTTAGGQISVYQFDDTRLRWIQKGNFINGISYGSGRGDQLGDSVSISGDGNTIAASAPGHSPAIRYGINYRIGRVDVYMWNGVDWVRKGSPIIPATAESGYDTNVNLSDDGLTLVVGRPHDQYPYNNGSITIYKWNGSDWEEVIQYGSQRQSRSRTFYSGAIAISANAKFILASQGLANQTSTNEPLFYSSNTEIYSYLGLQPVVPPTEGIGNLQLSTIRFRGEGFVYNPCVPEVTISEVVDGVSINEIQSIIIPNAVSGTWDLSWRYSGQTQTVTVDYDADAATLRNIFGRMPIVGGRRNLKVTGAGTSTNPYVVEFINDLGAYNHRTIRVDASRLIGTSNSYISLIANGTSNEQKTITNTGRTTQGFTVTFGGVTSGLIAYNTTLNQMTSILEGMSNIGAGNIRVDGNTSDRDAPYVGPFRIVFIGEYGGQNVGDMTVSPAAYTIVTNWVGGPDGGTNERQKLAVSSTGGTYTITFTSIDEIPIEQTTADIAFNSTTTQIKDAIVNSISWINATDIDIKETLRNETTGKYEYVISYIGQYRRRNMPLARLDNSNLAADTAIVSIVQEGYGKRDQQLLTVAKAFSGSYTLTITVRGTSYTTDAIPWNVSASQLQDIITALPVFSTGNVVVGERRVTDGEQNYRYLIGFSSIFGEIPIITANFEGTLLCDPANIPKVPEPPYSYPLPDCSDDQEFDYDDGPLLCKPGEGEDQVEEEPCCGPNNIPDAVNVSRRVKIERELFDPNVNRTIKQLARSKGLNISSYIPYLRSNGEMIETTYETTVSSKMSIVLVPTSLDTINGRSRVLRQIESKEILPDRFNWPDCDPSDPSSCWPQ